MYVRKIEVDENQWSSELLPLLEDGPFRVCRSRDWSTQVTTWLWRGVYAPEGNHLKWQAKFQRRVQKSGEHLVAYVGDLLELHWQTRHIPGGPRTKGYNWWRTSLYKVYALPLCTADTHEGHAGYSGWNTKIGDSTRVGIETAQKRLSSERSSVAASSTDETTATAVDNYSEGLSAMSVYQLRKQAQESERLVQNIRRQIEELNRRLLGKEKTTVADQTRPSPAFSKRPGSSATCWNCWERDHVKRSCSNKRKECKKPWHTTSSLMVEGSIEGLITRMLVDLRVTRINLHSSDVTFYTTFTSRHVTSEVLTWHFWRDVSQRGQRGCFKE